MSLSRVTPKMMTVKRRRADDQTLHEFNTSQNAIDCVLTKMSKQVLAIEQKYNKIRQPCFDKRNASIQKIPNFWYTTFLNHPQLSTVFEGDETDCLRYLSKLEVQEFEDIMSGYWISFHFNENPYFRNATLVKKIYLDLSGYQTSHNTEIQWKEGKDLTQKGEGKTRPSEPLNFFRWFTTHEEPGTHLIGDMIKEELWINPLKYFLRSVMNLENGVEENAKVKKEEDREKGLEEAENTVIKDCMEDQQNFEEYTTENEIEIIEQKDEENYEGGYLIE